MLGILSAIEIGQNSLLLHERLGPACLKRQSLVDRCLYLTLSSVRRVLKESFIFMVFAIMDYQKISCFDDVSLLYVFN